jgi:hypothetical protein
MFRHPVDGAAGTTSAQARPGPSSSSVVIAHSSWAVQRPARSRHDAAQRDAPDERVAGEYAERQRRPVRPRLRVRCDLGPLALEREPLVGAQRFGGLEVAAVALAQGEQLRCVVRRQRSQDDVGRRRGGHHPSGSRTSARDVDDLRRSAD